MDEQGARIEMILGGRDDLHYSDAVERFFAYIRPRMQFPCDMSGSEPFVWEIPFLSGKVSAEQYERLKRSQPSHEDRFTALGFGDGFSTWMRYQEEDITIDVRRTKDGRTFWLGLAELKVVDPNSPNYQLVDDYVSWVRSRAIRR